MTPTPTAPTKWICSICRQPIDYGIILVDDRRSAEMPGYDPDAPVDTLALDDHGVVMAAETASLQVAAAQAHLSDPGVLFNAYHFEHAPPERGGEYHVTTDRALRIEQWVAWISHLSEKNWIKRSDLVRAIRFWCTGHGIEIPQDLM